MNMDWILECFPEYKVLVEFDNIETKEERQEIHELKERTNTQCMFCKKPFKFWGKKDTAHAVPECLGNKNLLIFANVMSVIIYLARLPKITLENLLCLIAS